jgi:radical SAM protein with 4Fe4S-binding SPASM domain
MRPLLPVVPRRVHLELTSRCDLQCLHCAGAMHAREKGDMDYTFYLRTIGMLRRLGVREVGLGYFGEPFLCRWLPEAIEHAKRDCGFARVFVVTNGRLATPERVRDCIEAGLDRLEFSTSYAGPDQFHYVTGAREQDFWKVDVNLIAARLVRDEVEARTGHRCELLASSLYFDGEQPQRMSHALERIRASADAHRWRPLRGPFGSAAPRPCAALFEDAHISYDGKLVACPYDHDARFAMGDLTSETFLEVWHGARFAALRAAHLTGDTRGTPCETCAAH